MKNKILIGTVLGSAFILSIGNVYGSVFQAISESQRDAAHERLKSVVKTQMIDTDLVVGGKILLDRYPEAVEASMKADSSVTAVAEDLKKIVKKLENSSAIVGTAYEAICDCIKDTGRNDILAKILRAGIVGDGQNSFRENTNITQNLEDLDIYEKVENSKVAELKSKGLMYDTEADKITGLVESTGLKTCANALLNEFIKNVGSGSPNWTDETNIGKPGTDGVQKIGMINLENENTRGKLNAKIGEVLNGITDWTTTDKYKEFSDVYKSVCSDENVDKWKEALLDNESCCDVTSYKLDLNSTNMKQHENVLESILTNPKLYDGVGIVKGGNTYVLKDDVNLVNEWGIIESWLKGSGGILGGGETITISWNAGTSEQETNENRKTQFEKGLKNKLDDNGYVLCEGLLEALYTKKEGLFGRGEEKTVQVSVCADEIFTADFINNNNILGYVEKTIANIPSTIANISDSWTCRTYGLVSAGVKVVDNDVKLIKCLSNAMTSDIREVKISVADNTSTKKEINAVKNVVISKIDDEYNKGKKKIKLTAGQLDEFPSIFKVTLSSGQYPVANLTVKDYDSAKVWEEMIGKYTNGIYDKTGSEKYTLKTLTSFGEEEKEKLLTALKKCGFTNVDWSYDGKLEDTNKIEVISRALSDVLGGGNQFAKKYREKIFDDLIAQGAETLIKKQEVINTTQKTEFSKLTNLQITNSNVNAIWGVLKSKLTGQYNIDGTDYRVGSTGPSAEVLLRGLQAIGDESISWDSSDDKGVQNAVIEYLRDPKFANVKKTAVVKAMVGNGKQQNTGFEEVTSAAITLKFSELKNNTTGIDDLVKKIQDASGFEEWATKASKCMVWDDNANNWKEVDWSRTFVGDKITALYTAEFIVNAFIDDSSVQLDGVDANSDGEKIFEELEKKWNADDTLKDKVFRYISNKWANGGANEKKYQMTDAEIVLNSKYGSIGSEGSYNDYKKVKGLIETWARDGKLYHTVGASSYPLRSDLFSSLEAGSGSEFFYKAVMCYLDACDVINSAWKKGFVDDVTSCSGDKRRIGATLLDWIVTKAVDEDEGIPRCKKWSDECGDDLKLTAFAKSLSNELLQEVYRPTGEVEINSVRVNFSDSNDFSTKRISELDLAKSGVKDALWKQLNDTYFGSGADPSKKIDLSKGVSGTNNLYMLKSETEATDVDAQMLICKAIKEDTNLSQLQINNLDGSQKDVVSGAILKYINGAVNDVNELGAPLTQNGRKVSAFVTVNEKYSGPLLNSTVISADKNSDLYAIQSSWAISNIEKVRKEYCLEFRSGAAYNSAEAYFVDLVENNVKQGWNKLSCYFYKELVLPMVSHVTAFGLTQDGINGLGTSQIQIGEVSSKGSGYYTVYELEFFGALKDQGKTDAINGVLEAYGLTLGDNSKDEVGKAVWKEIANQSGRYVADAWKLLEEGSDPLNKYSNLIEILKKNKDMCKLKADNIQSGIRVTVDLGFATVRNACTNYNNLVNFLKEPNGTRLAELGLRLSNNVTTSNVERKLQGLVIEHEFDNNTTFQDYLNDTLITLSGAEGTKDDKVKALKNILQYDKNMSIVRNIEDVKMTSIECKCDLEFLPYRAWFVGKLNKGLEEQGLKIDGGVADISPDDLKAIANTCTSGLGVNWGDNPTIEVVYTALKGKKFMNMREEASIKALKVRQLDLVSIESGSSKACNEIGEIYTSVQFGKALVNGLVESDNIVPTYLLLAMNGYSILNTADASKLLNSDTLMMYGSGGPQTLWGDESQRTVEDYTTTLAYKIGNDFYEKKMAAKYSEAEAALKNNTEAGMLSDNIDGLGKLKDLEINFGTARDAGTLKGSNLAVYEELKYALLGLYEKMRLKTVEASDKSSDYSEDDSAGALTYKVKDTRVGYSDMFANDTTETTNTKLNVMITKMLVKLAEDKKVGNATDLKNTFRNNDELLDALTTAGYLSRADKTTN